jgi:hypothetical protein
VIGLADDAVRRALSRGHRIDITTTGRQSGRPRRIELVFHAIEGRIFLSGRPGFPRSWIANLLADPRMTFHLKGPLAVADLPAHGRVIREADERGLIIPTIAAGWGYDPAVMLASSPLVEVTFD